MKTLLILTLMFSLCFPLLAQTTTRNIPVCVPPVTGNGVGPDDNDYITGLIIQEVSGGFTVTETREDARYVFIGTLIPIDMYFSYNEDGSFVLEEDEELDVSRGSHVLHLVLQDNYSGDILAEQDLVYSSLEDVNEIFSFLVLRLISSFFTWAMPDDNKPDPDEWRKKMLYFSVYALWTPRIYTGDTTAFHGANFGFGLSAELHLKYDLAVDLGLAITPDWVTLKWGVVTPTIQGNFQDVILEIPLSLLYTIRPAGAPLLLEPYAGIQFNIPLYGIARAFPVGWRAGFQCGMKAGPGIAYADVRFSMDFAKSQLTEGTSIVEYNRYLFYLAVGYKYGINPNINSLDKILK
jgi:hypothetical protein